jgi:WD40 repeat protein
MDFSEAYRYSGPPPTFSPDGVHVAIVVEYRVAVRNSETLKVVQLFSCVDKIHEVEWSQDGQYILCTLVDRAVVQVWSVNEPQWSCKIDEGPAGIQHACWVPGSRGVLTVADFNIRTTIWSLTTRKCTHLAGPKDGATGLAFSKDGSQLALVEVGQLAR